MKLLTLIQAAALAVLAVFGAYASSETPKSCPSLAVSDHCDL
ncbi:hypothetical protein ACFSDD_12055 [Salipiger marinus]|jgi:hypothetical protein|uniref:Uncharacterized protein n=1 Tax=Salipiger marinus TaxID=555512 RepID=A0A1G8P013_9RHOB|nr:MULTISPECIES: hypothetical protein [Salipiger]MEB3420831.1 hypothetical protein [Salipiger manganoxidans]SDI85759.1 hypothetical protein SAMN04487993_101190 [Salipiger marinus]